MQCKESKIVIVISHPDRWGFWEGKHLDWCKSRSCYYYASCMTILQWGCQFVLWNISAHASKLDIRQFEWLRGEGVPWGAEL
jgi:hypothetical protein